MCYNCDMDRQRAHQELAHLLKLSGNSLTAVRKSVFDALLFHEPMSLKEIQDRIGSAADRASIYRTIELFEQLQIAQRIAQGWKYKLELTDKFSPHHHHITCYSCGQITAINEEDVEANIRIMTEKSGFIAQSHVLEVSGLCGNCQKLAIAI